MTATGPIPRADNADQGATKGSRAHGVKIFLRDILIIFIAAILISLGIKTFLVRSFYIPSGSMMNTLQENDRIIVNQLEPRFIAIDRGDVLVFRDPGGWLTPQVEPVVGPVQGAVDWFLTAVGLSASDTNDHLIKRVIGLPGDTVVCCDEFGQIEVDGTPLIEPYIIPDTNPKVFSVTVPEGSLWVQGDNRGNSLDSRWNQDKPSKGFVPIENVVGRAVVITWPYDRWTFLDDYPDTFRGVDDE